MTVAASESAVQSDIQLPNFLVIGAMKSGSTSLARYLGAHPQVYMAPCKEIHFFDRHYDKGIQWYAAQFSDVSSELAVGEATPNYLYFEDAIDRMASTVPQAKLIAVLRNPVDRAYSHFWHEKARGRERLGFEKAIAIESERLKLADLEIRMHFSYLDQGRYLKQLEYVSDSFPRKNLLVLLSEDLRHRPESTIRSICRFIGVDDHVPDNVGKKYNSYISFRSLKVRSLAQTLSSRGRVAQFLGRVVGRLNTRRVRYPAMATETRTELTQHFLNDNRALSAWLGRGLEAWME